MNKYLSVFSDLICSLGNPRLEDHRLKDHRIILEVLMMAHERLYGQPYGGATS